MTSRERLLTVLRGGIPDCVPVAPDFSNMIPARLTGKPFWELYLYRNPPIWEAYIACARHFGIDSLMDGYFPLTLDPPAASEAEWETFIVERTGERIVTQRPRRKGRRRVWAERANVYCAANPPTLGVPLEKLGLPAVPTWYEPLEGVRTVDTGPEGLKRIKALMGDQGLVGVRGGASTLVLNKAEGVFDYYDDPAKYERLAAERVEQAERWMGRLLALEVKPDFVCVGGSGTLVFQTVEIMRRIALPAVKRVIEMATEAGIPTHVHACGPERELVRVMAEETALTVIDPLEPPPMGDCDLAELKRRYGHKLTLKGNLQTTDVLLRGRPEDVARASRRAIDDAAAGGRFILSTGDQCGRDTPDENLRAMIETARSYGRYG